MKLFGITTTYNCEDIVPHVMKYLSALGYDRLIVYDNESTDNTVNLLKNYPFVDVRTYCSGGIFCEEIKHACISDGIKDLYDTEIKEYSQNSELTWVTICDFDEVYFYSCGDNNFKIYLERISNLGFNVCTERYVNLISDDYPQDYSKFVHQQVSTCAYTIPFLFSKPTLFRLDNLQNLYLYFGCHRGNFKFFGQEAKDFYNTKFLHAFHLKYAFGQGYLEKNAKLPFKIFKDDTEVSEYKPKYMEEFLQNKTYSVPIKDYFINKMLSGYDKYEHGDFCTSADGEQI